MVISTISDPRTFNPLVAKETSSTDITNYLFEGLAEMNYITTEMEPALAQSWGFSDDGLVWTFRLRSGVKWFDGQPLTADDVLFTFNDLIYNDNIATSARDVFTIDGERIKVEKVDALTVRFTLPKPFAPLLRSMSTKIVPKHLLEDSVVRGDFDSTWGVSTLPELIIGTGPYMVEKYIPSDRVILKKNPNWWKVDRKGNPLPYVEKIVSLIVPDTDIQLLKFQTGETHIHSLLGDHYPILKPREREGDYTLHNSGPTFTTIFLVFNQNLGTNPETGNPFVDPIKLNWFKDKKFRQAIAHLMDKETMVDSVFNGLGYPLISPISQAAVTFYNPNVRIYGYDREKAKKVLAEASYIDRDGDGWIEDKDGNRIEFNMATVAGYKPAEQMGTIIQEDLKNVGIKVSFAPINFNTLVGQLSATFDWDAIIIGLASGLEPHLGRNVWASSGHLHSWYPKQQQPATRWEARIDEIFNEGATTLNLEKRKRLYNEFQEIVAEEVPVIYLVAPADLKAIRNNLGNIKVTPNGSFNQEVYFVE